MITHCLIEVAMGPYSPDFGSAWSGNIPFKTGSPLSPETFMFRDKFPDTRKITPSLMVGNAIFL